MAVVISRSSLVINYDFPRQSDEYLHRVGRAGRFGGRGLVINYVRTDPEGRLEDWEYLKRVKEEIPG